MENERSGGCYINGRKVSLKTFLICLPMIIIIESVGRGLLNRLEDDLARTITSLVTHS